MHRLKRSFRFRDFLLRWKHKVWWSGRRSSSGWKHCVWQEGCKPCEISICTWNPRNLHHFLFFSNRAHTMTKVTHQSEGFLSICPSIHPSIFCHCYARAHPSCLKSSLQAQDRKDSIIRTDTLANLELTISLSCLCKTNELTNVIYLLTSFYQW